jgi:hypothetical protein
VNPDLVVRDKDSQIYPVRYDAVDAMLLNEFLKEHRKVEELEVIVAQEREEISLLKQSLKAQASQIAAVSDQLALQKNSATMVAEAK